jgi:hypothetical protein
MNVNAIIITASLFLLLLGFIIGYLLGWRSGHLTGIEYAMKIWLSGVQLPSKLNNPEVEEYTKEVIAKKGKRLQNVREETLQQIEELRKSGIK